jgi:IclR family transcriptional regulator, KDG regulon repressor
LKISSLDKALQIIEVLSKNPQGLSLLELNQKLGFPKSTIHHILSTFIPYDYVSQDPAGKKYGLGFRFLGIGRTIIDNLDIRKTAHDSLRKLHRLCHEAVHLSILRNGLVTYVDMIQKEGGLSLATYIGFTTDPHAAAGGKILLSGLSDEAIRDLYQNRSLKRYGKNTITQFSRLLKEIHNIRSQGYAVDDEEYYEGVRCVAAPVRAGGKIAAALSVTGSIFTITMERIQKELVPLVKKTAEEISATLQW